MDFFCCSCSPGRTRKLIFPLQSLENRRRHFENLSQVSGGGVEIKNGKHLKVDCIVLFYKVIFLWGFLVFIPARLAQFQLNFRLGLSRVSAGGGFILGAIVFVGVVGRPNLFLYCQNFNSFHFDEDDERGSCAARTERTWPCSFSSGGLTNVYHSFFLLGF